MLPVSPKFPSCYSREKESFYLPVFARMLHEAAAFEWRRFCPSGHLATSESSFGCHSSHAFVGDSDVGGLVMLTELLGIKRVVITLQVEFHTLIQLGAIIFKFYCAVILKYLVHV